MRIIVIGCNHRTAPVAIREQLAFDEQACVGALRTIRQRYPECESVLLSTCNRTELYLARPVHGRPRLEEAVRLLAESRRLGAHEFAETVYHHEDSEAARHLFRVVSSLDSMVVGESQILGQAKAALAIAQRESTCGKALSSLFQRTFAAAKEVRTETEIGVGHVSVGSAAVAFAEQIFSRFADKVVLMIGTGAMGELTLQHLMAKGPEQVCVTGRTAARAEALAARVGARAVEFDRLIEHLVASDIVITCTGSREPIVTSRQFASVPARRRYRPLLIIDLAVPRDVDSEVGAFEGVFLYNIDDLQTLTESTVAQRLASLDRCDRIIEAHVQQFTQWLGRRDVAPTIRALRKHLEHIGKEELNWVLPKLSDLEPRQRQLIEQMLHRVIRKVLHEPAHTLNEKAANGSARVYAETLRRLFELDSED